MLDSSLIIGGASKEHKRHDLDFYPTPSDCTSALLSFLNLPTSSTVWEPACGDGAISKVLSSFVQTVISTELREDSGFGIGGVDFLASEKKADIVITNPPFDVAEKFILKCHNLDIETYCMLLKSQYWHSKRRSELFKHTKPSYVLPLTWRPNFAPTRGSSPTMDMIWTVWIKGTTECKYRLLQKDNQNKLFA